MINRIIHTRSYHEWLSLPVVILLLASVLFGTGEMLHSQLLKLGNQIWPSYHELRKDPSPVSCDPNLDIEAELDRLLTEQTETQDDEFDLFADAPIDPEATRASLLNAKQDCQLQHDDYQQRQSRITYGVKLFRGIEASVASLGDISLNANRYILIFLLLICAFIATLSREHIALRPMRTTVDFRVSLGAQLIGHLLAFISALRYRDIQIDSGIVQTTSQIFTQWTWIVGFALLSTLSFWQVLRIRHYEKEPGGKLGQGLLSIPLYTYMVLIAGFFFYLDGHHSAILIHLSKMLELSGLFINVGLYVWIGMLLKQTRLASLVFDTFRPWKMPPEVLAFLALLVSALPTAYTGASGIYIIAVGAVIYTELRRANARRQLALATTAMSGSMGVVLRPCLLVVIVAALNKEVTTSGTGDIGPFDFGSMANWGLYTAGFWVFMLTATLFLIIALCSRQSKTELAPFKEAMPATLNALKPIVPYFLIGFAATLFYRYVLNGKLDEFSAPIILPVLMLSIVVWDQIQTKRSVSQHYSLSHGLEHAVRNATHETTGHIGALLMLMGMSICLGGVFESIDAASRLPSDMGSVWQTMGLLVVVLVLIGMVMDPYGAVILVTITLAKFAYSNGIHPLHFWMVTLLAFELGYLTPPVALNHLLTRHVVGEEEVDIANKEGHTFWQRHERILLPITVMAIALLLVAFIPLAIYS